MRERLMRSPWWVQVVISGALFGVLQFPFYVIQGGDVVAAGVGCLVGGLLFGLVFGTWSAKFNRSYLATRGDLSPTQARELRRTLRRARPGSPDPRVRTAALDVLALRREQHHRQWWAVPMFLGLIALSVWLAATDTWWWLLAAALQAGFLGLTVLQPWRIQRREEALR